MLTGGRRRAARARCLVSAAAAVVAMLAPGDKAEPPDAELLRGLGTLAGARHVLRAPDAKGGLIDLWVVQVRMPGVGPGAQECRILQNPNRDFANSACGVWIGPGNSKRLTQGVIFDDSSLELVLSAPAGTTHFIVTQGDRRTAVIPMGGEALGRCRVPHRRLHHHGLAGRRAPGRGLVQHDMRRRPRARVDAGEVTSGSDRHAARGPWTRCTGELRHDQPVPIGPSPG